MEDRSLFEMITEGFDSALEWAQGKTKLRVTQFRDPGPPPRYEAEDVVRIRESVHLSQGAFAKFLGVSRKTVASWEQGVRTASTGTSRLLQLIEDPHLLNRLRAEPAYRSVDELDEAEPLAGSAASRATVQLTKPAGKRGPREASSAPRARPRTVAASATTPKGRARAVRAPRKAKGSQ